MRVDLELYHYIACITILLVLFLAYNQKNISTFLIHNLNKEEQKETTIEPSIEELVEKLAKEHVNSFSEYLYDLDKHKVKEEKYRKIEFWLAKREQESDESPKELESTTSIESPEALLESEVESQDPVSMQG